MRVEVETLSPIRKKLHVVLPPERVDSEFEEAYRKLARRVRMPGFRPGHAPRRLLEAQYGEAIREEVVSHLVRTTLRRALEEQGMAAVADPQVHQYECAPGQPFTVDATIEIRPAIEPRDYAGVALDRPPILVTPDDVSRALEAAREEQGTLRPIEGVEQLARDHWALLTVEASVGDRPVEGLSGKSIAYRVGRGGLGSGFDEAVLGMKPGEARRFEAPRPGSPAPQEPPIRYQVVLEGIREKVLSPLDDEFAKDLGYDSLGAAREGLRRKMVERKQRDMEETLKGRLVARILEKNRFEVPKALVEREREALARDRGPQPGTPEAQALEARLWEVAEERVRAALLLDAIAQKEKITVTEDDLEGLFRRMGERERTRPEAVRERLRKQGLMEAAGQEVRREKTLTFLLSRARVAEGPTV